MFRALLAGLLLLTSTVSFAQEKQKDNELCGTLPEVAGSLVRVGMVPVYKGTIVATKSPVVIWIKTDNKVIGLMQVTETPPGQPDLACVHIVGQLEFNKDNLETIWGRILGEKA